MQKVFVLIMLCIFLLFSANCFAGQQWILFHDKEIKGYVVDVDTQRPIEGAIVIGMWTLVQVPGEGFGGYANVIEVKTDKEGKFVIPSWKTFKPWKVNSVMHELAPEIVIYKPGCKVYHSHKVEREGFWDDYSKTEEEKKKIKEAASINPAKLKRVHTDAEIWKNHMEFRSETDYPAYFSKKQLSDIFSALELAISGLPIINDGAKKKITTDIKEDREYWLEGKR